MTKRELALSNKGLEVELHFREQRYELFETLDRKAGTVEAALERARATYVNSTFIGKRPSAKFLEDNPDCIGHLYIQSDTPRFSSE